MKTSDILSNMILCFDILLGYEFDILLGYEFDILILSNIIYFDI
jgi:hypothetical protein